MNAVVYKAIQSAIMSLSNSTDLCIVAGGMSVSLTRQQSPYLSHRGITYSTYVPDPAWPPGSILFHNGVHTLAINLAYESDDSGLVEGVAHIAQQQATAARTHPVMEAQGQGECIPRVMVQHLLDLAVAHCMLPNAAGYTPQPDPLVEVIVAMPRRCGWDEGGKPVFERYVPEKPQTSPLDLMMVDVPLVRAAGLCEDGIQAWLKKDSHAETDSMAWGKLKPLVPEEYWGKIEAVLATAPPSVIEE